MNLIELVYVSKAGKRLNQDELEGILSKARKNNTDTDITESATLRWLWHFHSSLRRP